MTFTGQTDLLPTTKHRRGRLTRRQSEALGAQSPYLLHAGPLNLASAFGTQIPVVLDIGFGTGEAVVPLARQEPGVGILAIDMHTPGIGDLLFRLQDEGITNVRILDADARIALSEWIGPASLHGVRTFFPDPWPKKRHHRRRLVQSNFVDLVAGRVHVGGFWHLATDWSEYAEHMVEVISHNDAWSGGVITRPAWRPQTRYERRGLAAGRESTDLWFVRQAS